jgi:hypothetical protein
LPEDWIGEDPRIVLEIDPLLRRSVPIPIEKAEKTGFTNWQDDKQTEQNQSRR